MTGRHGMRYTRVSIDFEGSGTVSNVPLYAAPAVANLFIGITAGALECLGASGIEGSYRDVTASSPNGGFDMVAFRVELKWRLGHTAR
jgi:hypothetical protein